MNNIVYLPNNNKKLIHIKINCHDPKGWIEGPTGKVFCLYPTEKQKAESAKQRRELKIKLKQVSAPAPDYITLTVD